MLCGGQSYASPLLVDWAFYDNGVTYESLYNSADDLPDYFDTSGFDWATGLGSIIITYTSPGDYFLISFFDLEFSEGQNTYYNEYGDAVGSPEVGQSWEIDEPGYMFGDIYENVLNGLLDNTNNIPYGSEEDVSMALGWEFILYGNETALITLTISELMPTGFYLSQTDSEGTIYFSSDINIFSDTTTPVPEPSTIFLFSIGMICIFAVRNRTFHEKLFSFGR